MCVCHSPRALVCFCAHPVYVILPLYCTHVGLLPLTFQIIYLVGWSPSAEQPKPKERGAYEHSMKSIDQVPELQ